MATPEQIERLNAAVLQLEAIDRDRILRPDLGAESLSSFADELDELIQQGKIATQNADQVSEQQAIETAEAFEALNTIIRGQADRGNADFITNKQNFRTEIDRNKDRLKNQWPAFVAAAIVKGGFLTDDAIRQSYDAAVRLMKQEAQETINSIRTESEKVIADARDDAKKIEGKARQTAAGISIKDAQNQFANAQRQFNIGVGIWAAVSAISIGLFVFVAWKLTAEQDIYNQIGSAIYHAAIRVTILTALGAAATFALRIFRAQLHMREHNLHRQRVANSIASFVEAASTPEQRDIILIHLVESIVAFGDSGLLTDKDDSIAPAKLTIDSITRNITLPK